MASAGPERDPRREQAALRVARILDLAWRIAYAPKLWTRAMLAAHHEVSERQITQDLQVLRYGLGHDIRCAPRSGYYYHDAPSLLFRPPAPSPARFDNAA